MGRENDGRTSGTSAQVDMTQGSLWDKILLFAVPVAVTAILQQLYNTADIAVAGRLVGTNAEAGIGKNPRSSP